jgi:hypothetical protein
MTIFLASAYASVFRIDRIGDALMTRSPVDVAASARITRDRQTSIAGSLKKNLGIINLKKEIRHTPADVKEPEREHYWLMHTPKDKSLGI